MQKSSSSLLRNYNFLALWGGQALSMLGSQVSGFALPFLMLALTNNPLQAGLILFVQRIPYFLFSLPVGALIDRWNRKYVMIVSDLVSCLTYASVPIAILWFQLTLVQLYLMALVSGTALVFFDIADNASFPNVVSKKQLYKATALMEGTTSTVELLGPGIGGFLLGLARTVLAGSALAYFIDSLSYLASVFGLALINVPFQVEQADKQKQTLKQQISEGLRFLWRHQRLRLLAMLSMSINFLIGPVNLAVILLARGLRIDTLTTGLIFTIGGIGGVVGAFSMPWFNARLRTAQVLGGAVLLWIIGVTLLALASGAVMLITGWSLCTFVMPIFFTTAYTYRTQLTPDALQGRVNSIYRLLSQLGAALGPAFIGFLLDWWGARYALCFIALGLLLSISMAYVARKAITDH